MPVDKLDRLHNEAKILCEMSGGEPIRAARFACARYRVNEIGGLQLKSSMIIIPKSVHQNRAGSASHFPQGGKPWGLMVGMRSEAASGANRQAIYIILAIWSSLFVVGHRCQGKRGVRRRCLPLGVSWRERTLVGEGTRPKTSICIPPPNFPDVWWSCDTPLYLHNDATHPAPIISRAGNISCRLQ